ncbi:MAG: type III pantothenate kinase [Proteobacteria bacterium]|nr:type III pantothenate kinase [Pseudomonadota bacterium]MDA1131653.1 type III pantothenate kinase [Pseudomonadota bacterium]
MLLAIDCGNTNIVFGLFDGDRLASRHRAPTPRGPVAGIVDGWLRQERIEANSIDGAVLATVVPVLRTPLVQMVAQQFGCAALVVGEKGVAIGMDVRVDRPEEVGADRLVNAVAAREQFGSPVIVLDFGTATTFDVVAANGDYRGGVIAPGVNLSLEALYHAAARLPEVRVAKPARVIGTDTVSAMQSGIYWGYIGLIEGIVGRIRDEMDAAPKVVATGGLAHLYAQSTAVIEAVDADLTLHGLRLVWERNRG